MGFFKDFKEDLSQAVNELSDDASKAMGVADAPADDVMVDTLEENATEESKMEDSLKSLVSSYEAELAEAEAAETAEREAEAEPAVEEPVAPKKTQAKAKKTNEPADDDEDFVSDETAIITPGLAIKGDIVSAGSIELLGKVEGNVSCKGKLVVSGTITGNSISSDFFADKAKITGDINCDGPAKIGNGSVIIGNLVATSAVIAGAIKGDIDVHGPVIVDTTAIVMGDIKSKLVQINNGAVIEGHVSQCYSDNSPKKFFGEK